MVAMARLWKPYRSGTCRLSLVVFRQGCPVVSVCGALVTVRSKHRVQPDAPVRALNLAVASVARRSTQYVRQHSSIVAAFGMGYFAPFNRSGIASWKPR
jgi:hypothetical protein